MIPLIPLFPLLVIPGVKYEKVISSGVATKEKIQPDTKITNPQFYEAHSSPRLQKDP